MSKKIIINDEKLTEEFLAIFSIGLIECIKRGVITTNRAESWLFSPVIAYSLSKHKLFSLKLRKALNFASEHDAASKFPCFSESLDVNQNLFVNIVSNSVKENNTDCGDLLLDNSLWSKEK